MNEISLNRRASSRSKCRTIDVTWRYVDARRRRAGWLSDISETGLAYVSAGPRRPRIGEIVHVTPRRGRTTFECKVVRLEEFDSGAYLVGCRRLRAAGARRLETPPANGAHASWIRRGHARHSMRVEQNGCPPLQEAA
jgi:hypothetical protein